MGQEIQKRRFNREDFSSFRLRLAEETALLRCWFRDSRFADCAYVGGLELEACLIDEEMYPAPFNNAFLKQLNDPNVVPELAAFNFEINIEPQNLANNALHRLQFELENVWERCRKTAGDMGGEVIAIGVLPSLDDDALSMENMSQSTRYRALNEQVLALRGGAPITLDICGHEHLNSSHSDVMLESAATSFQIHLQFPPASGVRIYNAALIASAPLLAMSANSPYVFGRDLWDESRIPLFEQSIDIGRGAKRTTFGKEYINGSLMSCFDENLAQYPVLLPELFAQAAQQMNHLRLHNGTVWRWNRPLIGFDKDGQPHLRIENRVVPAGPTMDDMMANAAFFWGLTLSLSTLEMAPESVLDFRQAEHNFYQAARHSLRSKMTWLDGREYCIRDLLIDKVLPMVETGLDAYGLDAMDIDKVMQILFERAERGQNGATWQRDWVAQYGHDMSTLSRVYLELQKTGLPVHAWKL